MGDRFLATVAPLAAPVLPKVYYHLYTRSVEAATQQLPALEGLPALSMGQGYIAPCLHPAGQPDETWTEWQALSHSPRVAIVGPAGVGKSTLLRSLAWRLANMPDPLEIHRVTLKHFGRSCDDVMPIWVDLAQGHDNGSLLDAMLRSMARHGFPKAEAFLRHSLAEGCCAVLLDGSMTISSPAMRQEIDALVSAYPHNLWVIAARPEPEMTLPEGFTPFELEGIAPGDIERFAQLNLGQRAPGVDGIVAACERSVSLRQLACLPLMAAAMCQALQERSLRTPRLSVLCEACLRMLLEVWSADKAVDTPHERRELLQLAQDLAFGALQNNGAGLTYQELLAAAQASLPSGRQVEAEALCAALSGRTGLLVADHALGGRYRFIAPLLLSYLAAHHLLATGQERLLLERLTPAYLNAPLWRDTLTLTVSLAADPVALLDELNQRLQDAPERYDVLTGCVAELRQPPEELAAELRAISYAALERDAPQEWLSAAAALAGMARRRMGDYFAALLRDTSNAETRRLAALALGRLGQDWAIPALGTAIRDPDVAVCKQTAWALGQIPSSQSVTVLSHALRNADESVRQAGIEALAHLARRPALARGAVSLLVDALDSEAMRFPEVPQQAEAALQQVGSGAMPQLMALLSNRQARAAQRARAARILGRMGDPHALPILIENILNERTQDVEGHIEALAGVGAEAVPALIQALDGSSVMQNKRLITALARVGAPAVDPLIQAIGGSSIEVRNAAVRALEQIGDPAMDALMHTLLYDARPDVRRRALNVLSRIGNGRAVATLVSALQDSDEGVRMNAVRYLGSLRAVQAVPALIDLLSASEDIPLRRTALYSLGEIGHEQAIPALIAYLADPDLRDAAASALRQMGEGAVMPLITVLHTDEGDKEVRQIIWSVVAALGEGATPDTTSLAGLASAYTRLNQSDTSPEEILEIAAQLGWWEHGRELHLSLQTADALAQANGIEQISRSAEQVAWLAEIGDWLRPNVERVLRDLLNIIESTNMFYGLSRRDSPRDALLSARDALLSALDRLSETQDLVQASLLPFEQAFFSRMIDGWEAVIHAAVRQLRGQASLQIDLLTPRLPIREGQVETRVVFRLFNRGDSAARNLSVTVRSEANHGERVQLAAAGRMMLGPLGIGEQREIEVPLAPRGATRAALVLETRYDDDERQGAGEQFSCHIEFERALGGPTSIGRSPYIVGLPVRTEQMFFGRLDAVEWVRDNISNLYQVQPLLIYGERRMGKTSLLYQLQQRPPLPDHIFVLFDLQLYGPTTDAHELLFEMAHRVVVRLSEEGISVQEPPQEAFTQNPYRTLREFWEGLDGALGDRRVVVMMDEFGLLMDKVQRGVIDRSFFEFLRGLAQHSTHFTFIFAGAYEVRRMQQDFGSILFNMPKVFKLSYLTEAEARELIERPVQGVLSYHPLVVQKILAITACHPYFTQYICDELVQLARREKRNYVELADLNDVIQNVVQDATGNIQNSIYDRLSRTEKLVVAAAANITDDVRVFVPLSDIDALLQRYGFTLAREEIVEALRALAERDLLLEMPVGQLLRYAFKMGLIRMWLKQNEVLLRLGQEKE
jgi:HEAT repeat protein